MPASKRARPSAERRHSRGLRRLVLGLVLSASGLGLFAPAAGAQQPAPGSPSVLDGPTSAIVRPSGLRMSIARDGTGGLVYLKQVGGASHVFVSQLAGGVFRPPAQADAGLPGASSEPVIAAGNGGLLLVAFINAGELYVVNGSGGNQLSSPAALAAGAINPSISATNLGKAYLAFAAADRGGYDVRAAYYVNGRWSLEGPPLNAVAADDAGTGAGRPAVVAAGDGVSIVVWGENGHIYSRRVWRTSPSVVYEQADAPPAGCTEGSADTPVVGAGGDSSFGPVAFHELVTCGGHSQSRVLMNRLHASIFDGIVDVDGLSGAPPEGANDPQVAVTEYGRGWVTSARTLTSNVIATQLEANGWPVATAQANSLAMSAAPHPLPATAGLYSTFMTWQQEPGLAGAGEIRVRYAPDGASLGPEMVLSSPAQGPTDAGNGLAAAGDVNGDGAVAWLQGPPGATQLVVGQMYQPPGSFPAVTPSGYATTPQPVLAWRRPRGWGPMKYSLIVDGAQVAQTYSTSAQPVAPLPDGPHTWRVSAANPGGQQSQTRTGKVFVDTVAPAAAIRMVRRAVVNTRLPAAVSYRDHPPAGQPAREASGVAKVIVRWGDGTVVRLEARQRRIFHTYRRAGRYRVVVQVTDKAGNLTRLVTMVKVIRKGKGHSVKPPAGPAPTVRSGPSTRGGSTPPTGGGSTPATPRRSKHSRAPSRIRDPAAGSSASATRSSGG